MVAIKDMETPRWCGECPMCREETIQSDTYTYCTLLNQDITWNGNRVDDCPLVEIGTCKDCAIKQLDKSESAEVGTEKYYCHIVSKYVDETPSFYCKYFKKRGAENENV